MCTCVHLIVKAFGSHCRVGRVHPNPAAIAAAAISGIDRLQTLGRDSFHLVPGEKGPCGWLSEALGVAVLLEERPDGGFPDDRDARPHAHLDGVARGSGPLVWLRSRRGPPPVSGDRRLQAVRGAEPQ